MNTIHHEPATTNNLPTHHEPRGRDWSIPFLVAGAMFVLYPAIRPFSDEASLHGAASFASTSWLLAHTLGMAAFLLLTLGLLHLHLRLQHTPVARQSLRAPITSWVGLGLILPFYGAETFGLAAIGGHAYELSDPGLLAIADAVRLGPGIVLLAGGLVLLAVGAAMFAAGIWTTDGWPRWSGVPLAVGLVLYLPQFLAPQPVRIGHGALKALGCLLLARSATSTASDPSDPRNL